MNIRKQLQIWQEQLAQNNNEIVVQITVGSDDMLTHQFNPSASEEDIERLKNTFASDFPPDYLNFLRCFNGGLLFAHPIYSSEFHIYSIDNVIEFYAITQKYVDIDPNMIRIDIAYIGGDVIVVDLRKWQNGETDYLMVRDAITHVEEAENLHCNFETWLERFLTSQGKKYWNY